MIVYVVGEDVKFSLKFLDLEWNDALLNENSDYYLMMERIVMGNVSSFFICHRDILSTTKFDKSNKYKLCFSLCIADDCSIYELKGYS